MKILLVSESWYATLGWCCARVLTKMGCQVYALDNKKNHLPVGPKTVWEFYSSGLWRRFVQLNHRIVNMRFITLSKQIQPDLILMTKCENIHFETLLQVKQNGRAVIFNWYPDNPFNPPNTSRDVLRSLPLYDAFGIWAKFLIPALYPLECRRVEYLPMYFYRGLQDPNVPVTPQEQAELSSDISFVGGHSSVRERTLLHLADFDLGIWGPGWDRKILKDSPLIRCVRGSAAYGEDFAKILKCSKIGLNVLSTQNKGASNTRTFEVTGLGTLLLTEYSREQAEDLFIEDQEIVCFRSPEELRDKARYYLTHDDEREAIARRGQTRTLRDHTLENRIRHILAVASEIIEKRTKATISHILAKPAEYTT